MSSVDDVQPEASTSRSALAPKSPTRSGFTHTAATEDETAMINASIAARRRKSTLVPLISEHRSKHHHKHDQKRGRTSSSSRREPSGDEPEDPLADGAGRSSGVQSPHEGRESDEEGEGLKTYSQEEMKKMFPARVMLLRKGESYNPDDEEGLSEEVDVGVDVSKQEFVWDVLFENQRGIHLFGKAYFSSSSLLPADPSAFTVPSHSLPNASSLSSKAKPDANGTTDQSTAVLRNGPEQITQKIPIKHSKDNNTVSRPIKTAYTLETFQTPSPTWTWLTTWMVNMRTGTDENGWRYNAWFKSSGWKSHSGTAGWGGWVRRREWVRLRCRRPREHAGDPSQKTREEVTGEDDGASTDHDANKANDSESKTSTHSQAQLDPLDPEEMIKTMGKMPLDRTKLDSWKSWLDEAHPSAKSRLQSVLYEDETAQTLSKSFVHHASLPPLLELFRQHDLDVRQTVRIAPSSPRQPSPCPSALDPQESRESQQSPKDHETTPTVIQKPLPPSDPSSPAESIYVSESSSHEEHDQLEDN